ncbi:MAG: AMP-binding protein, partial [Acetobacteraceae bacterium]|nr:AMP-binding protein [Acetobacteraceae bacterium]
MQGLMQSRPLMISSFIAHAARHHGAGEVVSRLADGTLHRTSYAQVELRARRLVRVLEGLGIGFGDMVGTLAWNNVRHLELYYAASGMGAVCHTVNPRLAPDDIAFVINDGDDRVLFTELDFVPLVRGLLARVPSVRAVVVLCDPQELPDLAPPPGVAVWSYEALMAAADPAPGWPEFDENTASLLCHTS